MISTIMSLFILYYNDDYLTQCYKCEPVQLVILYDSLLSKAKRIVY